LMGAIRPESNWFLIPWIVPIFGWSWFSRDCTPSDSRLIRIVDVEPLINRPRCAALIDRRKDGGNISIKFMSIVKMIELGFTKKRNKVQNALNEEFQRCLEWESISVINMTIRLTRFVWRRVPNNPWRSDFKQSPGHAIWKVSLILRTTKSLKPIFPCLYRNCAPRSPVEATVRSPQTIVWQPCDDSCWGLLLGLYHVSAIVINAHFGSVNSHCWRSLPPQHHSLSFAYRAPLRSFSLQNLPKATVPSHIWM
jgi:hypothetical protein